MPGKKKSKSGAHLKAGSGRRPERKYNADTDEDPLDHEFRLEDRAGESSGDSGAEEADAMSVEMARELQALTGVRQTRAVKQQKVAHATLPVTPANAASSSTQSTLSSYFTVSTPIGLTATAAAAHIAAAATPTTPGWTAQPTAIKKYARRHCGYSLVALRACIPIALSQTLDEVPEELRSNPDLPVAPVFKQRRWARISWRYAAEYRKGDRGNAVVWAVARQSSSRHRDTNDPRARQAEAAMEIEAFRLCI